MNDMIRWRVGGIWILLCAFWAPLASAAGAGITYHGRLMKPDGTPVTSSSVQFQIQIRTPGSENCLMYQETQTKDLSGTGGVFSITINDGTATIPNTEPLTLSELFKNSGSFGFGAGKCSGAPTYSPNITDGRKLVVSFNDGSGWETLPAQEINFVPLALESESVGGKTPSSFLRVDPSAESSNTTELTAANLTDFWDLLNGTSNQYMKSSSSNGANLPPLSSAPTAPSAGTIWYDSTNNKIKYFDGTTTQTVGTSGGSVTGITVGDGLVDGSGNTGTAITTSGTIKLPDVGTADTYYKVTTDSKGRVTSGSTSLVESDLPNITTAGKVSGSALTSGTIGGTTAINTSGSITTGGDLTANDLNVHSITASGNVSLTAAGGAVSASYIKGHDIQIYDSVAAPNTHTATIEVPASLTNNYTLILPNDQGVHGQVLALDSVSGTTGQLEWQDPATGSVTSVAASPPLSVDASTPSAPALSITQASGTADGYLSSTDWTTFDSKLSAVSNRALLADGKVWIGDSGGKAEEKSLSGDITLTDAGVASVNRIKGYGLDFTTTPTSGDFLKYNGTNWSAAAITESDISGLSTDLDDKISAGQMPANCTSGQTLTFSSPTGTWACSDITVSGSNFASQTANTVLAAPDGSAGTPAFRVLTANDIPSGVATQWSDGTGGAIYYNGGNVGIGTTGPFYKLQVVGAVKSTTFPFNATFTDTAAYASNVGGGLSFGGYYNGSSTSNFSGIRGGKENATADDSAGYLALYTHPNGGNPTERMRIDSAGDVGIGTMAPSEKLEVNGNVKATAFIGDGSQLTGITASGVSSGAGTATAPSMTFSSDTDTGFYSPGANEIGVSAGGTNIFNLSSLGLTSPTAGGGVVTTAAGSSTAPTFSFSGDTDTGWYHPAADTLAAATGGTERVRIDASGNAGIGTSTPFTRLHVRDNIVGGAPANSGTTDTNVMTRIDSNGHVLDMGMLVNGDPWLQSRSASSLGTNANLILNPNGGNVGLGTTSPTSTLTVNHSVNNEYAAQIQNGGGSGQGLLVNSGFYQSTNTSPVFQAQDYGRTKSLFAVLGNGHVGIGTASPSKNLVVGDDLGNMTSGNAIVVGNSSGVSMLAVGEDSNNMAYLGWDNANNVAALGTAVGGTAYNNTLVLSAGNVGIGTAAPSALLDMRGSSVNGLNISVNNTDYDYSAYDIQQNNAITTTGTYYVRGGTITQNSKIDAGVTNNGYQITEWIQNMRNQGISGDNGTLNQLQGLEVVYGHYNQDGSATPSTNNAYGISIFPYILTGTANNMYDLFLATTNTGGTVANHYAIYQQDPNVMNYFAGNVGIGTTAPTTNLVLYGNADGSDATFHGGIPLLRIEGSGTWSEPAIDFAEKSLAPIASIAAKNTAGGAGDLIFLTRTNGDSTAVEKMRIKNNGNVGIGTTVPSYPLDVVGNINSSSGLYIGGVSICTSSGCSSPSDRRLKKNIMPLKDSLNDILRLQGVSYDWKDAEKFGKGQQIGFIAQDLEKIYPQVVRTDEETGQKSVVYDHLIAPVVEAIKSLYKELAHHEDQINNNTRDLASLKAQNAELKKENQEIKIYLCGKDPTAPFCR